VARHLSLRHGVVPLTTERFGETPDDAIDAALRELVARRFLGAGDTVVVALAGRRPIWKQLSAHSIHARRVETRHLSAEQQKALLASSTFEEA